MGKNPQGDFEGQRPRGGSKKHVLSLPEGSVQSCPESCRGEGHSHFFARSVQGVREHGKMATCLREAATAEAGNAAGGFFQQTRNGGTKSSGNYVSLFQDCMRT